MTEARRRFYQLVSTAALFALFSGIASADPNTGIIYGRVFLAGTHRPVCAITITARNDRQPLLTTRTGRDGSFHFFGVSPGSVNLLIGRDRFERSVLVSANLQNLDAYVNPIYLSMRDVLYLCKTRVQSV